MFSKLVGLQYCILYRQGPDNRAADALSRHHALPVVCASVSSLVPTWLAVVLANYDQDPMAQEIIAKLVLDIAALPNHIHSSLACSVTVNAD